MIESRLEFKHCTGGAAMKRRVKRHAVIQPLDRSYRLIPLTQNQNAIVDLSDFDWLSERNWYAEWCEDTQSFYARTADGPRVIWMHAYILGCGPRELADHKDGNTLDNRRSNLRKATSQQSGFNRRAHRDNSSGFKGVHAHRGGRKWAAQIQHKHIGYFDSREEAARAYDAAARELHGEFAKLNGV